MNKKDFEQIKFGKLIWESKGMYYRFEPSTLPLNFKSDLKIGALSIRTAILLGRLDGLTRHLSNDEIDLLRIPFIMKEARLSSEIEGTRSTLSDVYKEDKIKEKNPRKREDNEEIRNYAEALNYGLNNIENGISEDLLKSIHIILLKGVRGYSKDPGEYKISQNAVGDRQDTLDTAKFVPASPDTTPVLMKNFIGYLNDSGEQENIISKIAIVHYQFEAIHPFRDGNGRIGRLLITLLLVRKGILSHPLLYISEYLNRNRSTYTDLLYEVSSKGKINNWINFFLNALINQVERSLKLIEKLEKYKKEMQKDIESVTQSHRMYKVVDLVFKNPFLSIKDVSDTLGMSIPGASKIVHKLEQKNILKEITGKKSRKIFVAEKILEILEE